MSWWEFRGFWGILQRSLNTKSARADNEYRFWQKKGDPDVQVWLRQTSLTAHPFFGACELAVLRTSSNKRTLFPEKRMLRSAGRRGMGSSIKQLWSVRQPETFAKPKTPQEIVNSPSFPRRRESWLSLCNELFLRNFLNIKQDSRLRGNDGISYFSGCC